MRPWLLALVLVPAATGLSAQSVLERSPNLHGTWTLPTGHGAFVFAHRFELLNGGDELRNVPTLTVAGGLPWGITAGLDYTSNSELSAQTAGANETEYWLKRSVGSLGRAGASALVGYNSAARSLDGALGARLGLGAVTLLGELRGFANGFGEGEPAVAAGVGAVVHLTPFLGVTADVGRVLAADTLGTPWSAALAVAIPGTPHTFSLQATNAGATTLQGASRAAAGALKPVRYGFTFTVPLGTGSQWGRIFRPAPVEPAASGSTIRVEMRQVAFTPSEVRIRVGETVEWVNRDPTVHTATAADGSWGSALLAEGERYVQRFDAPGRFPYYCIPHPMMTGVVIVEGP